MSVFLIPADTADLLAEVAEVLRMYEASHRAKKTQDADAKAEVNRALAERIETHLKDKGYV